MPGIESFLDEFIPVAGDVAVDVGANHGYWSQFLAGRFVTVYAVEANPALHSGLCSLAENVRLIPYGAWAWVERRTFTQFAADGNTSGMDGWTGIMAGPPVGAFEAECWPLDAMPIEGKVDFIKIDTEGAELNVVLGAEATLQHDRPSMIIEVHTAQNGADLETLLGEWGYSTTIVRHPYYAQDDPWWLKHFWLVCQPN